MAGRADEAWYVERATTDAQRTAPLKDVDPDPLIEAIHTVARHESLRTSFPIVDGRPVRLGLRLDEIQVAHGDAGGRDEDVGIVGLPDPSGLFLSHGTATVAGFDVRKQSRQVRERIGLVGQNAAVDEHLTGYENLEMVGRHLIGTDPGGDFTFVGASGSTPTSGQPLSVVFAAGQSVVELSVQVRSTVDPSMATARSSVGLAGSARDRVQVGTHRGGVAQFQRIGNQRLLRWRALARAVHPAARPRRPPPATAGIHPARLRARHCDARPNPAAA